MRKTGLTFLLVFAATIGLYAQTAEVAQTDTLYMSLEEVIAQLKESNKHIQSSAFAVEKYRKEREAQKGLYLPQIDLSANYVKMSEALELDLTSVRDAILPAYDLIGAQSALTGSLLDYMANPLNPNADLDPTTYQALTDANNQIGQGAQLARETVESGHWVETIQEDQFAVVNASLMWPLYTGGKIRAANKAAEAKFDEAIADSKQVVSQEITSVVQRYFGLRLATNVRDVRQEVLDGMKQHLNDAKKMEENGMIALAERLHAEVAYADAERELRKANYNVMLMQTALQNSLSGNQPVVPMTDLFILNSMDKVASFVDRAKTSNPAIGKLEAKSKLAEQAIIKEQSAWLPNVFVMGQADLANYQLSEYMPEWMVGVGLRVNLFDGLQKVRKTQAAKMQKLQVESYQAKVVFDISTGVTSVYQQMQQALDAYEATQKSLVFAEEYVRVREKAFSEGFATSTDVVDARMNLAKVETEQLKAMFDFDIALTQLLQLCNSTEDIIDYQKQAN